LIILVTSLFLKNPLFFSKKGMSNLLLSLMILVVVLLVIFALIATQTDLLNQNTSNLQTFVGGLFGSTND